MNPRTALRACVPLIWLVLVADIASTILLHDYLPAQLRDWHAADSGQVSASGILLNTMGAAVVVGGAVASIGLFRLRRWAAWLFLISLVLGYGLMPFTGPVVSHGLSGALSGLFAVVSGMVLSLALFTDALGRNTRHPQNGGTAFPSAETDVTTGSVS